MLIIIQKSFFVKHIALIFSLVRTAFKFEKRKTLTKNISEELMALAWHPKRWWNFCMSEDEKKEIEPIFTE